MAVSGLTFITGFECSHHGAVLTRAGNEDSSLLGLEALDLSG